MIKKPIIIMFCLIAVGCVSYEISDPARYIMRNCPVKMVKSEDQYHAVVRRGPDWTCGRVWVIGECTFDSRAIRSWAQAHGLKGEVKDYLNGDHVAFTPDGSKYYLDYVMGNGLVLRRLDKSSSANSGLFNDLAVKSNE